jgi:nitroreductase
LVLINKEWNKVLDDIIEARHSIRKFKVEIPPTELVVQIIRAGLWAPYSGLAVSGNKFRRFIVISRDSQITTKVGIFMKRRIMILSEQLEEEMQRNPLKQTKGQAFASNLKAMSQQGVPGIGKAPYYIVVAEQKGIPPVEQRSLAHCMENMWLKATALGLGFQLLSITAQMAEDKGFCSLIDIPYGEFALDGCLIGYPNMVPSPTKRPQVNEVTKWMI